MYISMHMIRTYLLPMFPIWRFQRYHNQRLAKLFKQQMTSIKPCCLIIAGLCRVCQSDKARGTTNRNWEKSGFLWRALSENSPTSFVGKLFSHKSRGRILRRGFVGEFCHKSLSEKPLQRKKSCKKEKVEDFVFELEELVETKVAYYYTPSPKNSKVSDHDSNASQTMTLTACPVGRVCLTPNLT